MDSNHISRLSIARTVQTSCAPFLTYSPCSLSPSSDRSLSVSSSLWKQLDFFLPFFLLFVLLPLSPPSQIVLVTVSFICCACAVTPSIIFVPYFAGGSSNSKLDHQLLVDLIIHYGDGRADGRRLSLLVRMHYLYNTCCEILLILRIPYIVMK